MFGYLVWVREHRQVGIREIDRRDAEHPEFQKNFHHRGTEDTEFGERRFYRGGAELAEFGKEDFITENTEITESL